MTATPTPLRELIANTLQTAYLAHDDHHVTISLIDAMADAVVTALSARDEAGAVGWQYRMRPDWRPEWSGWSECTKGQHLDYLRAPKVLDWHYETRALFTTPPAASGDDIEQIREQADAWEAVFKTLLEVAPGWHSGYGCAMDKACDTIRRLAAVAPAGMAVTAEMVREAFAHLPFDTKGYERWEWFANFINQALARPDEPCQCCGVTPSGQITGAT